MKFGFHPAAEAEHLEQVAYYEAQEAGLGNRYLSQVESAIDRVCETPSMCRVERAPDIRRALVTEFPFHIIFRERGGVIQILAVGHFRRRPHYWLSRL
ncbi:MAG: type II toxin-antitoxin system RelE/ParE family toxin [Gammaproteobacteria bacterium]|nr:MAG: type II toxin-antitoxin system RelE/ParE family toxin [Gammaproteobacteria bacterium]